MHIVLLLADKQARQTDASIYSITEKVDGEETGVFLSGNELQFNRITMHIHGI